MILNPKLLIVDDERGIVDMIQSYFQTQYDILTAYSGQEALKKVACKPDLILLDINMPGMDAIRSLDFRLGRMIISSSPLIWMNWGRVLPHICAGSSDAKIIRQYASLVN